MIELEPLRAREPTVADGAGLPSREARHLIAAIKSHWLNGEAIDTEAALARYPELQGRKSIVVDLAYEEYCLRQENGEDVDPEEFCERFRTCKTTLKHLISAHMLVGENLEPGEKRSQVSWPAPGDSFAGFAFLEELGRGAFAHVYLAAEPALGNRRVAVKVSCQATPEAKILGRINHPNIVPVHSVRQDPDSGLTAVCMPYLGRATLCDVLDRVGARSELPARARAILEAVQEATAETAADPVFEAAPSPILRQGSYADGVIHLGVQMADALAYINGLGICHRDLKPSNVLLSPCGRPMLLDFNLSFHEQLTNPRVGGTLAYMAPEHLVALDPKKLDASLMDARSDLYSLGIILYELLGGTHPFGPIPVANPDEKLRKLMLERRQNGFRPLRQLNRRLDGRLARVVERCLANDPKDRPQSAAELAAVLRKCLHPLPRLRRWTASHRLVALGTVLLALATSVSGAVIVSSQDPPHVREVKKGKVAFGQGRFDQAVEHFTLALDANKSPETLFARARAYQRLGEFQKAFNDYESADKLAPDGRCHAGMGYCLSLKAWHPEAIWHYDRAILAGYAPAEVYNNRGFGHLRQQEFTEAQEDFDKALILNSGLQAAFYNRAVLDLNRPRSPGADVPRQGIADIRRAIELDPESADVYLRAALLCAQAAERDSDMRAPLDPRWVTATLEYVDLAVKHGHDPGSIKRNPCFRGFKNDPRFQALVQNPPSQTSPRHVATLVDPLQDPAN